MNCIKCNEPGTFFPGSTVCTECLSAMAAPVTMTVEGIRELARETVHQTFTMLGINVSDPLEVQRDFAWLRDGRLAFAAARRTGAKVVVVGIVTALIGAFVAGAQAQIRDLLSR